jgi:DNA polymerase V
MDVTPYLKAYKITPEKLAEKIIYDILKQTGITATAGIGTNLYLAKIAMDIKAKHMAPDKNGVRIASLDEISYRKELWNHKPLKNFWRIGPGYSRRLKELNINTMGELAKYSLTGADNLYKKFGKLAELLIDHAWGYEPVEMKDIKAYRSENHSLSHGQVLSRPYKYNESILILREMIDELVEDLIIKHVQTDQIVLTIIYDVENTKKYEGKTEKDFYGRTIPKNSHGTVNLHAHTDSEAEISSKTLELFHKIVSPELTIRKIYIAANHIKGITEKKKARQMDLFTDYEELEKKETRERRKQNAIIKIKQRYGKNSIIRAMDLEEGATSIKRNSEVGGHRG